MLPMLRAPSNASMHGVEEGPTVRQHLQQQQAAHRQRIQQEMMEKKMKEDDRGKYPSGQHHQPQQMMPLEGMQT